ncbi:MAG: hypothetical protein JWQ14_1963 [Adhaeribacter sp.]|nr:hypothetical protein [Adhaeribacter sp.]
MEYSEVLVVLTVQQQLGLNGISLPNRKVLKKQFYEFVRVAK